MDGLTLSPVLRVVGAPGGAGGVIRRPTASGRVVGLTLDE